MYHRHKLLDLIKKYYIQTGSVEFQKQKTDYREIRTHPKWHSENGLGQFPCAARRQQPRQNGRTVHSNNNGRRKRTDVDVAEETCQVILQIVWPPGTIWP
jgi:hypothetical protein